MGAFPKSSINNVVGIEKKSKMLINPRGVMVVNKATFSTLKIRQDNVSKTVGSR